MTTPFAVDIPVRFSEVDLYGVVWHGHFVAWLEEARNQLASSAGFSLVDELALGYRYPIVSLEVDYRRWAVLGDVVRVAPRYVPEPVASITFTYDVTRVADGERLARARSRQVALRGDELLVGLPDRIRDIFAALDRRQAEWPPEPKKGSR